MKKYDFKNPEHFKALEKQAYDGTIDVSDFPPVAYRYFDSLRKLYYAFKFEGLSKEDATQQKKHLYSKYCEALEVFENAQAVYAEQQKNIRLAGTLLSDIEKSRDVTEIALMSAEVIGHMTGDKEFLKRMKNKLEVKNEFNVCISA